MSGGPFNQGIMSGYNSFLCSPVFLCNEVIYNFVERFVQLFTSLAFLSSMNLLLFIIRYNRQLSQDMKNGKINS